MPIALVNGHAGMTDDGEHWARSTHGGDSMQVAIVGMACRLPGYVSNLERFWDLCLKARDTWSEVPPERFSQQSFYHPNPERTNCVSQKPLTISQLPNAPYGGTPKAVTSCPKISHASTLTSSVSPPKRRRRWTHSSVYCWSVLMRHSRMPEYLFSH